MSLLGLLASNCCPAQQPPSRTAAQEELLMLLSTVAASQGQLLPRAPASSCASAPRVSLRPQHGGTELYGEFSELLQLFCLKKKKKI